MSLGLQVDSEIWGKKSQISFHTLCRFAELWGHLLSDLGEQSHLLHLPKDRNKPGMAPSLPLRIFA